MTGRSERQEQDLRDAIAAHEAEWKATHGPLGRTEGEEFFADLPQDGGYDEGQRRAVRDVRGVLARLRPSEVRPEATRGNLDDRHVLMLRIPHRSDPWVSIDLVYGDGYLSLAWPDGKEHGGGE